MTTMEEAGELLRRVLPLPTDGRVGYELEIERHGDFMFILVIRTKGRNGYGPTPSNAVGSVIFESHPIGRLAVLIDGDNEDLIYGFAKACRDATGFLGGETVVPSKPPRRPQWTRKSSASTRGEANKFAKLTEDDVREIRRLYEVERLTYREIAARYGVRYTTIWKVVKRVKWAHVD